MHYPLFTTILEPIYCKNNVIPEMLSRFHYEPFISEIKPCAKFSHTTTYMHHAKFFNNIYAIGFFDSFCGVLATFWYLSWIAGVVFLGVAAVVFVLGIAHYKQLSEDKEGLKKAP